MKLHQAFLNLTSALTIPISAFAFPQPQNSTTPLLLDSSIQCSTTRTGPPLLPPSCLGAITLLPMDQTGEVFSNFSNDAAEPRHRLPVYKLHGNCILAVRLTNGRQWERSAWRWIARRAAELVQRCVVEEEGVGGRVVMGQRGGLEVVVCSRMGLEGGGWGNRIWEARS